MRKKIVLLLMAVWSVMLFAGCGTKNDVPKEEVSYAMIFCNETEQNVSELRLRPLADYDWTDNLLKQDLWQEGFEVPVNIDGLVPVTKGWEVKLVFEDGTEQVWKDVVLQDKDLLTFSMQDGQPQLTHAVDDTKDTDALDENDIEDDTLDTEAENETE